MIKGLKICGISDPETLNYILNHNHKPIMIGFITNYEKSKRFVEYDKLKDLINLDKKQVNFVSVLVNPNDEILEKIKDFHFDYYQLYDVSPERTKEIIFKYKIKIITAITVSNKIDVSKSKFTIFVFGYLFTNLQTKCDPIKPAPPVIKIDLNKFIKIVFI